MSDAPDLTGMLFMPLYVDRLQKSKAWLQCKREPALAFYLMNLWMRAWHEIPAGSIEDDDDVLCDAAMCDPKQWDKLKPKIIRGWERRDDGRLYHGVVVELAAEAWAGRQAYRERAAAARQAKEQKRLRSIAAPNTESVTDSVTEAVTEPDIELSLALKGKREGQSKGEGQFPLTPADAKPSVQVIQLFDRMIVEAFGPEQARPYPNATDTVTATRMLDAGADLELLEGVFRAACMKAKATTGRRPDSLRFVESRVEDAIAERNRPRQARDSRPSPGGDSGYEVSDADREMNQWRARVRGADKVWLENHWGPRPGQPGCWVPPVVLAEFGIGEAA